MKLFKKNGKWWVDFTADGRRHRQSTGTANRKLAEAWMENIQTARRMPTFESAVEVLKLLYSKPVEGRIPIDATHEAYERMAKAIGKTMSAKSAGLRRNAIERFVKWMHEKRPTVRTVEAVNGPIAAAYAEKLAQDGLKTKTRRNTIGELSATWNVLEKVSGAIKNPWKNLAPPDVDGERGEAFTPSQEEAVLEAAKKVGKDWWPVCMIMRLTGLRYGDVATMTWNEVHDDALRIEPNKNERHNKMHRSKAIRVTRPMTEPLREVLAAIPKRGPFLFPMHEELYVNKGEKSRLLPFREVLDAAGIKGSAYSVHSWRHTTATKLAEKGVDIETRMRILGHTEDVTARRYDHADHFDETVAALEKINA